MGYNDGAVVNGFTGALYTGCEAISVEKSTWGNIKKMYRD